jgi:hypothetical protein
MRVPFYLAQATVTLLCISCVSHPPASHQSTEVTVDELRSAPDRFDGACVLVKGFLLAPMVGDIAIFQTEPDYHRYHPETGIPLALDPHKRNLMPFQLKQCVVEGMFHASRATGVRSQIGQISRLELAE